MNLDELRSVQSKERQKDSLQHLRPSFYREVGDYIADLKAERDRAADAAEDPFSSPEVSRLTDEIETAKDVVEAIYERRMGKLVKQASLAAAGMAADDEGLTAEEADLFDDLVDRIESNKGRVLDVLEGADAEPATGAAGEAEPDRAGVDSGTETGVHDAADPERADSPPGGATDDDAPPVPPQEPPPDAESSPGTDDAGVADPDGESGDAGGVSPADVMGGEDDVLGSEDGSIDDATGSPETKPSPPTDALPDEVSGGSDGADDASDPDRVTVRITRDVGSILGVDDREYTLSSDDVVTLPEQNATPLVEREAAEPLE